MSRHLRVDHGDTFVFPVYPISVLRLDGSILTNKRMTITVTTLPFQSVTIVCLDLNLGSRWRLIDTLESVQ